jgi:hypothetical protein
VAIKARKPYPAPKDTANIAPRTIISIAAPAEIEQQTTLRQLAIVAKMSLRPERPVIAALSEITVDRGSERPEIRATGIAQC